MSKTNTCHTLIITDAKGSRKVPLGGLKYTVGRDVSNNIQLHSRFVSRHHAILLRVPGVEPGRYSYRIIDGDPSGKPSVNGLTINSHNKATSHDLNHGDVISLAPNVQIVYLIEDASGSEADMMSFERN
jgi:pSer/pThr/pTyr-binding forkhead associated (FHA) protein